MLRLLVLLVGAVLLLAAILKLLDPFWAYKVAHSWWFASSIIADVVMGSLLVSAPRSRWSLTAGFFLYASYTVYRICHWSIPCDCFGVYSSMVSDWGMLLLVVVGSLVCGFAWYSSWLQESARTGENVDLKHDLRSGSVGFQSLGIALGCVGFVVVFQYMSPGPPLRGVVATHTSSHPGVFDGTLKLSNETAFAVRLLGNSNTKCKGSVSLKQPIELSPSTTAELRCSLPGIGRGDFATGTVFMHVELQGKATTVPVPWICRLPIKGKS
jgi:hypothetical protein